MGKFVGVSVVLFMLAAGFVVLTQGAEVAALANAVRSQPLRYQVAWAIIVLVPLAMLIFAAWQRDTLVRQRRAAKTLELRLDGVRQDVKGLTKLQGGADADVQHLTRTDPEDAIAALQRRITEAERFAEIQRRRNEETDLKSRIDELRAQQQALKERLAPVLEFRRAIERDFAELDGRQNDIDRALSEIASGDDAVALDIRLKNLTEFVRQGNLRCDQIERASKTLAALNEACAELGARLVPVAVAEDGLTGRLRELHETNERLTGEINRLEHTPEGPLAERVQVLAADKKQLEERVVQLDAQFAKLANLRKESAGLFAAFGRAVNLLAIPSGDNGGADIDVRIGELSRYIEQTRSQLNEIEHRAIVFGQLKERFGELQSRLAPLEADESGVVRVIEELHDTRERLVAKIRRIEGGEDGDLAARVKVFAESKRELEQRVSSLADQFARLASIRKDIGGLFVKLSDAASPD